MRYEAILTDIVLLAIFFLVLYIATYCITHYPEITYVVREFFSSRDVKVITSFIVFPIGIVFLAIGIRLLIELRLGGGKLALGFILTALGASLLVYSITTIIDVLLKEVSKWLHIIISK